MTRADEGARPFAVAQGDMWGQERELASEARERPFAVAQGDMWGQEREAT